MSYSIEVRHPIPGRHTLHKVTVSQPGVPWPIILSFFPCENEDGSTNWINAAIELGPSTRRVSKDTDPGDLKDVDPAVLERVANQYPLYLRLAREALEFDLDSALKTAKVAGRGQGRRGLTDDFLRRIAAEVADWRRRGERHIPTRIAAGHYVNRSTASRWITEARNRGYIEREEGADG